MISLDQKTSASTSSSPIGIVSQEETSSPTLSFSELLRGAGSKKDAKEIQNGVLVLALDEDVKDTKVVKADSLLSLLKGETPVDNKLVTELNPAITKELTPAELKALVKDAKNYLRDKITASEGFKKSEIASLPKTLKGLAQVADKFGIDVSKITLQEVKADSKVALQTTLELESDTQETKGKGEVKTSQISDDVEIDLAIKLPVKTSKSTTVSKVVQTQETPELDLRFQENLKNDVKEKALPESIKSIPLFKAQATKEITTEQFVQARISTTVATEVKPAKSKADETLKMLLRGDKVSKKETGFTADFSVATARVIAPQATTEAGKNLESLLHGDKEESTVKLDGLNVNKADSFEVKLNEAKQMTKYLSQDVKTAIEDYKSPFTRIKVQLNPQRFGEVDLTVIQRGKNLHINLTSNNAAINTLALNSHDLKTQLANNGINNATLNFNNNSQSSEQSFSGQQQQNFQNEREAKREYDYFDKEETNEELINSLEIVVPYYA